jgi:hypothetical protein
VVLCRRELQNHNKTDRGRLLEEFFDHVPKTERYRSRLGVPQEGTIAIAKKNAQRASPAKFFELPGFVFQCSVNRIAGK